MKELLAFISVIFFIPVHAQQTGRVDYKYLGLSFTIPNEWVGQETESGYIMGSNFTPGRIILLPHDRSYTLEELTQLVQQGLSEGGGTYMSLEGQLENISDKAVGGVFSGTLNYEQAKGYLIGLTNEFGNGLTVISVTSPTAFSSSYKNYALEVVKTINFYKPETDNIVNEWTQFLSNHRLSFIESYNSAMGGMVSGYNIQRKIDLCSQGYFNYQSNSSMSINNAASNAYGSGNSKGNGTWSITVDAGGNAILKLNYYSGEVYDYTLAYQNDKLYLNGERYFRISNGENGPACY